LGSEGEPPLKSGAVAMLACAVALAVAVPAMRLPLGAVLGPWVGFELDGLGYEVSVTTAHEAPLLSTWLSSDRFGWPGGMDLAYFFSGDYLHLAVLKAAAALVGVGPAMNLYLLAGFPLAVLTASWFARRSGLGVWPSLLIGLAFALLPYHFIRATEHYFLGMIWSIPVSLIPPLLAVQALDSGPIRLTSGWGSGRRDLIIVVGASLVTGVSGVYYLFFALLVWVPTAVVLLVRRPRRWGWTLSPTVVLVTAAFAFLPSVLVARRVPPLADLSERGPDESLLFSGTLPDLFGTALLDATTWEAAGTSAVVLLAMGLVAGAVGLRAGRLARGIPLTPPSSLTLWLSGSLVWLMLWWFRGGLGYLFALTVTPQFRSLGRLLPFVALLAMTLGGRLVVRWLDTSPLVTHRRFFRVAVSSGVVALTVASAVQQVATPLSELVAKRERVGAMMTQAQDRLGGGCPIAVTPLVPLPEGFSPGSMQRQATFSPMLEVRPETPASTGALRSTLQGAWEMPYAYTDPLTDAYLFGALGFCAMVVDFDGFRRSAPVSEAVQARLGEPIAMTDSLAVYSLGDLDEAIPRDAREDLLHPAVLLPVPGSPASTIPSGNIFWAGPPSGPAASSSAAVRVWNTASQPGQVLVRERHPRGELDPYLQWASSTEERTESLPLVLDLPAKAYEDLSITPPNGASQIELFACRLGSWVATDDGLERCE